MDKIDQLIKNLEKFATVVVTTHRFPDDDAIGSILAMTYYLQAQLAGSVEVKPVICSPISQRWSGFKNFSHINSRESFGQLAKSSAAVVALDGNQYHRFSPKPEEFNQFGYRACIDHHASQPDEWDWSVIQSDQVATATILETLLYQKPDTDLAKALVLGIIGDTGNLRFVPPEQAQVFDQVKRLIVDAQINLNSFRAEYDYYSKTAIELQPKLLANRNQLELKHLKGNVTFIPRLPNLTEVQIRESVNLYNRVFALIEEGVSWSFVIYPFETKTKISARSLPGSLNVRKVLELLEWGSGHDRAAGGLVDKQPEAVAKTLTDWLKVQTNLEPLLDD